MVNYKDGKIYKLVGGGLTYIGSTTQRLSKRKSQHKIKKNCSSRQLVDYDDFDIILIENFPCESKEELHARERYYIENTECVNKIIPTRTRKEQKQMHINYCRTYRMKNKESVREYARKYREKNEEARREYARKYRENNREARRESDRQYREKNREARRESARKYREKNREKINERRREARLRKKEEKERENLQ